MNDVQVKSSSGPASTQSPQRHYERKRTVFRAYQVIWYVVGVLEALLGFRLLLRLLGANPASGFTDFIYSASAPFALPFRGVVASTQTGNTAIEWSTLLAMLVYVVVAYGLVKLLQFIKPADPAEVERTIDTEI